MYTVRFFSTPLGRAALASIVAMAAMNGFALSHQLDAIPAMMVSSAAITGQLA